MKKVLLLTGLFCFTLGSFAQDASSKAPAEVKVTPAGGILKMKEDVHDFGKIPQGKPVHYDFVVENKGTAPLQIKNVQASCGCTTPEWEKDKDIPVNGTTTIKVGYNAQAEGPFTKSITITYNETETKVITIKGEVWKTPAASAPENSGINELKN